MTRATVVARAPGRVNLIGDHTDYTGGFCLPIAIDRWVEVAGRPDPDHRVVALHSTTEASSVEVSLDGTDEAAQPAWGRFVAAVARRVDPSRGFAGTVRSDLPIGAGLSSSAALEVAVAMALGADRSDPLALAMLCRDAEHEARGVPTGLLDQLASILAVADHALLLDCSTNTATPTPLPPSEEAAFVVLAGAPRQLASTGYAERVAECGRIEEQIGPFRAASPADVERLADPTLRRRARHVVGENARVHELAAALADGDLVRSGRIMAASHRSLRDDYESSSPAVDRLCADVAAVPGVFGARITGGGWGGSVVALVRPGTELDGGWPVHAVAGATVEVVA